MVFWFLLQALGDGTEEFLGFTRVGPIKGRMVPAGLGGSLGFRGGLGCLAEGVMRDGIEGSWLAPGVVFLVLCRFPSQSFVALRPGFFDVWFGPRGF